MASCMEKTAAWILEIPAVQDAKRRLPDLGKKYRKLGRSYSPVAFLHPPPWCSLRITKHVLPSPTSSPWSEGWSPAWDASDIRLHWTTNSCLQRWHWSGTCRREKRASRKLVLGKWTQNKSLSSLCILHMDDRSTVQTMENLRGRGWEKQDNYFRNWDNQARQGNCPCFVTGIGKQCPMLSLNEFPKAHL